MQPLISLIIPNRNGTATLARCLRAALASRYPRFEVIVVDDASTDDSVAVIRRYPCRLVRLERHGGAARARNVGAADARGQILFFTDADCLLEENALARAAATLARAGPGTVVGGTYTRAPADRRFFSRFQSVFIHYNETRDANPDYLATHALALRAADFRARGGFREDFLPILEDVEFSHRLRRHGHRLVMNPAIRARHVFNYSAVRSFTNAFRKSMYWTLYSLRARDLFTDSGTASLGLKANVAAYAAGLALLALALFTGEPFWAAAAGAALGLSLYVNRGLLAAFHRARGLPFAFAAGLYYLLVYPLPVGAGAAVGVLRYLEKCEKWGRSEFHAPTTIESNTSGRKFTPTPFFLMHSPLRHLGSILWKRRPIQLTFFVTRKCNARCPFCFYLAGSDPPAAPAPELSLPEIERIAGSLGHLLWLAFSGGEPYLRRDLPEISRIFYRRNRPAIMLYPTNGLTPELIAGQTERILRDCPKSVIAVKLSLDGVGEEHDRLRGTPGGFAKVIETYERLTPLLDRYPRFELGVNTVFCRANQDQMDAIADFVARLKRIRTHTVSLVRGELADAGHKDVDLGKYQRIAQRLGGELRRGVAPVYAFRGGRLKAAQDIVQRRLILRTAREQQRLIDCYAGRLNLVLSETGEVYPCETRTETLGNVRDHDYDLHAVMRATPARETLGSIVRRECACTHECYFITNILFNPRLYPALAKEYLALAPRGRAAPDAGRGNAETTRSASTARTGS